VQITTIRGRRKKSSQAALSHDASAESKINKLYGDSPPRNENNGKEHVAHGRPTSINWGVSYTFSIRWTWTGERWKVSDFWRVKSFQPDMWCAAYAAFCRYLPPLQIQIQEGRLIIFYLCNCVESGNFGERCSRNRLIEKWPLGKAL